ncbi:MAG: response regulator [Candidatus Adiutrix sp.]|jgi:putative two-component system response regulator|nr:response regulator [Candidatus Adiutrix sp.]
MHGAYKEENDGGLWRKGVILIVGAKFHTIQRVSFTLQENHSVMTARSSDQAVQIALLLKPDLILIDLAMPEMHNFELSRRLQSQTRLSAIPILFLTDNDDVATEVRCLEAGARDIITSPFEKNILLHRVANHLRLARYQRYLQQRVSKLEANIGIHFAALIECRDKNTGGHVQRSGQYFSLLAMTLANNRLFADELAGEDIDLMVRAAPLHDLGKISVSDTVLLKPGRLTDREFDEIKKHPGAGARIIESMLRRVPTQQYLIYAQMIAENHHERYDGQGYPHGLKGREIPLCGRIMSVVDVYDALVSDRIYRKAMSHEEACDIIKKGRESSFDPGLVDVFCEINDLFCRYDDFQATLNQLTENGAASTATAGEGWQ